MKITNKSIDFGEKTLSFELGKIAKQASGSVVLRMDDTMVLVTACSEESQRQGVDFLPLTVDYRENTYASGRIPGGFFKREGRPTEREILTCRVIDRGLRPLFPDGYYRETQVIAWVLSADGVYNSDIYGISGASLALLMSPMIPFTEAIAGVRIGRVDGRFPVRRRLGLGGLGGLPAVVELLQEGDDRGDQGRCGQDILDRTIARIVVRAEDIDQLFPRGVDQLQSQDQARGQGD